MFETGKRWSLAVLGVLLPATLATAQISTTPLTFSVMTTVGTTSQPVTVSLTAQNSGTLTSLVALTGGSPNLDFAVTPISCALNMSLTDGESCTVSIVFSPRYAGVRQGAVVAKSGNQLLASAPLSGVGGGSLPVLVPGTINTVAGDGDWIYQRDGIPAIDAPIFLPSGLAVDAAGDLFLCELIERHVLVEGADYPIAIGVGKREAVWAIGCIRVSRHIQPLPTPTNTVLRRRQQAVHHLLEGVGRVVSGKVVDLLLSRGQTNKIVSGAADQGTLIRECGRS